jgi:hypothetical protein
VLHSNRSIYLGFLAGAFALTMQACTDASFNSAVSPRGTGGATTGTGGAAAGVGGATAGTGGAGAGGATAGTGGATAGVGGAVGTGGATGTGGITGSGSGGSTDDAGTDPDADPDGASAEAGPTNLMADPGVEGPMPGPWWRMNACGAYGQSMNFVHTGTYSAMVRLRDQTGCGVGNNSLPVVNGHYSLSMYALWDAASTGLTTLPLRVTAAAKCNGSYTRYVTIRNSIDSPPGQWIYITGQFNVETTAPASTGSVGCDTAGQTLEAVNIYLEQASGTVYPDLYVDDIDVH